jgi:hypothetical protein
MTMDPIPLEDLALLEVLQRIDRSDDSTPVDAGMKQRLFDSALAEEREGTLRLTAAGVAMCKSLQHRVQADRIAERIQEERDGSDAA